jgi:hypothetical protein
MFWQGIGQRDFAPHREYYLYFGLTPAGSANASESGLYKNHQGLDFWRPADEQGFLGPNTDAWFPAPGLTDEGRKNHPWQNQSRYVVSAAYMRLKSLQFGYTIPQRLSQKVYVQKARIYISGENLFTFTKLPDTCDPELVFRSDSYLATPSEPYYTGYQPAYPTARTFAFGINITF